ncbi:hypothetical protein ACWIE6_23900 [Paenibacillus taichungensis]
MELVEEVNGKSENVVLEAEIHRSFDMIQSAFDQSLASMGESALKEARLKRNWEAREKGKLDGVIEEGESLLRMVGVVAIGGIYVLLIKSMRNEMQRVFYIADNEASETTGSEAVLSLLLKAEMEGLFAQTAEQVAEYQYNKELYEEFRKRISAVPTQEILRIQRVQEMNDTQNRTYHPPMKNRIELIREHWAMIPAYRPDAAKERRINEEFRQLEQRSQKILLNDLRDAS